MSLLMILSSRICHLMVGNKGTNVQVVQPSSTLMRWKMEPGSSYHGAVICYNIIILAHSGAEGFNDPFGDDMLMRPRLKQ